MVRFFYFLIAVLFFSALGNTNCFAQKEWSRHSEPVLEGGDVKTWNHHLMWATVIFNPDAIRYEMWFTATSAETESWRPMHIGFATSFDGISWTVHPEPVLEPSAEGWDMWTVEEPAVIRERLPNAVIYKMWYSASSEFDDVFKIGYATSTDGINWVKDTLNNPVMVPGSDAWQVQGFSSAYVIKGEDGYKMWYTGWSKDWVFSNIGYATSEDGISWMPDSVNNPVIKKGKTLSWDDGAVGDPVVILIDTVYHMWFCGKRPNEGGPWQTGWATSDDGIHWKKFNDSTTTTPSYADSDPVLKRDDAIGKWDERNTVPGTVFFDQATKTFRMWYNGKTIGDTWKIGYAETIVTDIEGNDFTSIPGVFSLQQNYPNPFNPTTTISYQLPKISRVDLSVYNLLGQKVATLVNKKQPAGSYTVEFDGGKLASGVYYYVLETDAGFKQSRKLLLLK